MKDVKTERLDGSLMSVAFVWLIGWILDEDEIVFCTCFLVSFFDNCGCWSSFCIPQLILWDPEVNLTSMPYTNWTTWVLYMLFDFFFFLFLGSECSFLYIGYFISKFLCSYNQQPVPKKKVWLYMSTKIYIYIQFHVPC